MKIINTLMLTIAAALLAGCSSLPATLVTANDAVITDYPTWLATDIDAENEVRLGGVIARVDNLDQRTRLEVVNMPISSAGKPDLGAEPAGRFVAYITGFVEPMSYAPGRLVTLLGKSSGQERGQVGEVSQQFRVMSVSGSHLWRIQESVILNDSGSYLFPCFGLNCRGTRNAAREGRVIQEVK